MNKAIGLARCAVAPGLVSLAMTLTLVACSDSTGPGPQGELLENARAWQAMGIDAYTFVFSRTCFCPVELFRPARITVRDGAVESATYVDDGQPVAASVLPTYQTIDELFEMIADAVARKAVTVDVTYDPDLHYPTQGYIDISEMIADEEQGFTASDLEPLAGD
jgi:hypothetical protein